MTRILFVTSNRIGDAVLSTGLLDHLLAAHPGARVTVACGPLPAPLFAAAPGVERVLTMTKAPRGGHWLKLWRQTVTTPWSLVVDLRASALAWLLPAWRRLVYRPSHTALHRVRQLGALVGRTDDPPAPRLWASAEDAARAAALVPAGRPVLAVGPTANWGGKQWPADRFVDVVARLTAPDGILPGAMVAVVAAPNERAAAEPVLAAIPAERRIDLIGAGSLPVIGAALGRCAFYLGNDSGLMHMAAAAGTPTLGLFGPSREDHYAPWGPRAAWVRTPQSFHDIITAPGYDHRRGDTLMGGLEVPTVTAAAEALWRRVGQAC
ncbi:glycosyltransferase family 9 protein [Novispirillum sp. DQ9]|uniref:glycosyltransferase family 9 protein n=1 Tax=Novispirillum sp. DQ9 TaxID=3398612 RepID=UPI003C7DB830